MFFYSDGSVFMRDCYSDAANGTKQVCDDKSDLTCSRCTGNLCNSDNQRRGNKCFKCEGLECSNDLSNQIDCLSECFIGVDAVGFPKKDCASAVSDSSKCGTSNQTCLTCDGDFCNGITFPTEGRLSCIKCIGEDCANQDTSSEYCERLSSLERCVSVFDASGIVERGCSSSIENAGTCSSNNPSKCLTCYFDNCNVANSLSEAFLCVSCNSEEDSNCISNPNTTQAVPCTTDLCYSQLLPENGVGQHIKRGCGVQCSGTSCSYCQGERCNSMKFPSDRNSCYHCTGDQCAIAPLQEKQCTLYSQVGSCVTIYGTGKMGLILKYLLLKVYVSQKTKLSIEIALMMLLEEHKMFVATATI